MQEWDVLLGIVWNADDDWILIWFTDVYQPL